MRYWLLGLALCLNCGVAQAMCAGTDVRPTLSATERQALDMAGETTPYGTGNHWVGRRNDQTIHVIGTMHLDDPRWTPVMRAVTPVVERADLLFVEMTDTDQLAMQRALSEQPERVFITDGPTLPELLSEDDWQRLSNVMAKRGVPKFMAAKMQPWMQTLMLGLPECALKTPELAQAGLDMRLMKLAREAGVPVRSLEGFEDLYALIADGSVEDQLDMLMASLPLAEGNDDQFITTAALYFEQETAAAWEFARLMTYGQTDLPRDQADALLSEFKTKLLDTRNAAWMAPILASNVETIVVAVGALHLMGEDGVLNLLDQAGYTLQRAAFESHP